MNEPKNIIYAQSGGVTPVINASAAGVIEAARKSKRVGDVFAGKDGIVGILNEELIDTSRLTSSEIKALKYTPAGVFGTARYKLKSLEENRAEYERLIDVFTAHNIGYFLYNGGGDSHETAYKISQIGEKLGHPIACIGIPKTIDNDLALTDSCPGFGSVAKYVAVSIREASLDVASMCRTSTKVFILEVMGRHAGWIAAAGGLAHEKPSDGPHIILFHEIPFDQERFLSRVDECVKKFGYASIVASEGLCNQQGEFLSASGLTDAFGHKQLGGVAPILAKLVKAELGYKYHWAVSDYLQRSARHIASKVDVKQAYALGKAAIKAVIDGKHGIMLSLVRKKTKRYSWTIGEVPLSKVAGVEKKMPRNFITKDGFHITKVCRDYLQPLIMGEDYPPYKNGLPQYVELKHHLVRKKLPAWRHG